MEICTTNIVVIGWSASSNTNQPGTYQITYTVEDSKGMQLNQVTITLTILPAGGGELVIPVINGVVSNQSTILVLVIGITCWCYS